MRENFAGIMKRLMVHEGGKVDHPKDPGGRTNQGVTQRVYDAYRRNTDMPARDVYLMTPAERDEIYKLQYWNKIQGNYLPSGVDYVVMDGAVNSGPVQAVKWLQRALGGVRVDGVLGEATLAAVLAHPDHDALIAEIHALRLAFLKALKTWPTFGRGWTARVNNVREVGQAWATGSVGQAPVLIANATGEKALVDDATALPSVAKPTAAVGMGATGLAILTDLKTTLEPYFGMSATLDKVILGLSVTAAFVAAGGAVWAWAANKKRGEISAALDLPVTA